MYMYVHMSCYAYMYNIYLCSYLYNKTSVKLHTGVWDVARELKGPVSYIINLILDWFMDFVLAETQSNF